jgi:outer membrane receptor protein involved in Fe transport
MFVRARWFLAVVCLLATASVSAQPARPLRGRTVQSVLDELRGAGAPLVYSSTLVPATLTVVADPGATTPLGIAREILLPHGLAVREQDGAWLVVRGTTPIALAPGRVALTSAAAYAGSPLSAFTVEIDPPSGTTATGANGSVDLIDVAPGRHVLRVTAPGFLPERVTVEVEPGATTELSVALLEAVPKLEELVVTASRYDVTSRAQPSATYFSRDEIESLASLGDDTVRVAHRMPGVANNEFSARPYVRGGAANEVAVLLDGVRLAEPYHLRDFQAVFSAIDQRIVDSVAVHAGGFPAAYGDALSGLMVVEPREPTALAHEVGVSVLYTSLLSSGEFPDERGSWLLSARNSNLERVLAEEIGEPAYSDVFVRVAADLGAKHRVAVGALRFRDDIVLTLDDEPADRAYATSDASSRQVWLKVESSWSDRLLSTTWLHATSFASWRREDVADLDEIVGNVDDQRALDALGLKQVWRYQPSDRQLWSVGFEAEQRDADYRYASVADRRGLLATLGGTAPPHRTLEFAPSGDSIGFHAEDRVRLTDRLVVDLGLRWDRQSYLPPGVDSQFSPRASLLYRVGERTDLRVSHGRFFQPEGLLELQVEDGVAQFSRPQSAAHSIVSVERRFLAGLALRAEVYRKRTRHVRPRFENLFDPLVLVPELRASRVLVAPERAEARGVELLVSGERPVSWWASVSYAYADDEIGGERVPRGWDQQRALHAGVTMPVGSWSLSAAANLHRGWPATKVSVVTTSAGERSAVAGPRNGHRLGDARRLDVRASRDFDVGVGELRFFAEITNLTNRNNPCCLVYEPVTINGAPSLAERERRRVGITGNVGVLLQF